MFTRDSQTRIDTLIGKAARVHGDVEFEGGLHLDGRIVGGVRCADAPGASLSVSETGSIEGEVQVPTVVLDRSKPPFYRWFADGVMNTCFNAVDRHVRDGRGQQAALIYDSPVTGQARTYTYRELLDETARVAGAFARLGVERGDRVVIYMPMVPEALMAMMACAFGFSSPISVVSTVPGAPDPTSTRPSAVPASIMPG